MASPDKQRETELTMRVAALLAEPITATAASPTKPKTPSKQSRDDTARPETSAARPETSATATRPGGAKVSTDKKLELLRRGPALQANSRKTDALKKTEEAGGTAAIFLQDNRELIENFRG